MTKPQSDLVMTIDYRIPPYFVSLNGQTKFYTLCNLLLESAARHAMKFHFGYDDMKRENIYWVLSRLQVRMRSYPKMDHPIKVKTWPKGINKLFFMRDYRICSDDGSVLADATSAWLILDGNTGRPKKIDDSLNLHYYNVEGMNAIEEIPGKLPSVQTSSGSITRIARYSDLDINKHVNAVKYVEWIQDLYPIELYEGKNVKEFQINYHSETRYDEEVEIRTQKEENNEGFHYFEGVKNHTGSAAFRAKILFDNFS